MTNETINVPELRFPEFEGEWDEKELGDIGEKVKTKNKFEKFDETFTNSAEQGIVSQKEYFEKDISNSKNLSNYYVVENNDFVYNPRISNYAPVGPINRNKLKRTGVMSPLYTIFKMRKVDYTFCEYFFSSTKWHNFMKFNGDSGARSDRFSIKDSIFFKMPIKVPTNLEQQKIGDFFSKLDRQIELEEEKLELLEQQKRGYMQKIFSQELRFKDANGNSYPKWEQEKLDDVANYRRGSFPQPYGKREWYDEINGEPFVQVVDVDKNMKLHDQTKQKISNLAKPKSVKGFIGDIVVTLQGSIGRVAILQYDAYIDRTLLLINSFKKEMNKDYFKYVLYLLFLKEKERAPGGTIKTITKTVLSNFEIDVPIIEEQEKIGNLFNAFDKTIEIQGDKINFLKQRKQGLLQKMFV